MTLPKGYYVLTQTAKGMIIGMDFSHQSKECALEITEDGKVYTAGPITAIALVDANTYCSCREYFFKEKTMTSKDPVILGTSSPNSSIWGIDQDNTRHISTKEELQQVAAKLEVRSDWHEPDEQGLTAEFHGKSFGNDGIWGHKVAITPDSLEQYITLHKNNMPVAEVNLADLLSWASNSPDKPVEVTPEHHEYFDLPDFERFLADLLVTGPSGSIQMTFLDRDTAAICCTLEGEVQGKSWSVAQISSDEPKILVSNTTGVHVFDCMTFPEAWDALQELVTKGAENVRSLSTLFNLVADRVPGMEAHELFKKSVQQGCNRDVNWYSVLEDLRLQPDEVLSDHVDGLDSSDADDEEFIDTAADHFGLDSDMLLETAGCDHKADGADWIAIAEDLDMPVPEAIKLVIAKGDPNDHHRKMKR